MRLLLQRVHQASVTVDSTEIARIGRGFLLLVGVEAADTPADGEWLAGKVARLRLFPDVEGAMNLSLGEVGGAVLVISQFTLHASTTKGNRPSFIRAARPELAIPLYEAFIQCLERELSQTVAKGQFGADMQVALVNDGPVTIWIDSKAKQ